MLALWQSLGAYGLPCEPPIGAGFGSAFECMALGEWSGRAERMRFARLIHRPVRVRGGPSARAACGGDPSLTWLPRRVGDMTKGLRVPTNLDPRPCRQANGGAVQPAGTGWQNVHLRPLVPLASIRSNRRV